MATQPEGLNTALLNLIQAATANGNEQSFLLNPNAIIMPNADGEGHSVATLSSNRNATEEHPAASLDLGLSDDDDEEDISQSFFTRLNDSNEVEFDKELFLVELRKYPSIWNKKHPDHKLRNVRMNAWKKLAATFNTDGE